MASGIAEGDPSPSASSLFLPLGRISRRGSKSSLTTTVDRETLSQALDNIHNVACHSQTLTIFDEYGAPPTISCGDDNKGFAGELQGSLSGLYNKLKATVGAARESFDSSSQVLEPQASKVRNDPCPDKISVSKSILASAKQEKHDGLSSVPGSSLASRVQSPVVASFDSIAADTQTKPSKGSSKTASIASKASLPPTPALRSPIIPLQKAASHVLADPTVVEVNVNAIKDSSQHSRNASTQAIDASEPLSGKEHSKLSNEAVKRTFSGSIATNGRPDYTKLPISFPRLAAVSNGERLQSHVDQGHEGERPENYDKGQYEKTNSHSMDAEVARLGNGQANPQVPIHSREPSTASVSRNHNAVRLFDDSSERNLSTKSGTPIIKSLKPSVSPGALPVESTTIRISQSRLPGFHLSRTSSSDSVFTGQVPGQPKSRKSEMNGTQDGTGDEDRHTKVIFNKLRSRLLSQEFWMRDENARDCFHCGEPFSAFRRKHHCRTCGQIFDSKCTLLVGGTQFGSARSVRVCKPCEAIINAHDDDSSDHSQEDQSLSGSAILRPHTPVSQQQLERASFVDDDSASVVSQTLEQMTKTPTMSFPVRRALDSSTRGSDVLEFDSPHRPLLRPSSSRSLKTARLIGHGHKRHHSRHQHIRTFKAYHEERAPFQRKVADEIPRDVKQSAFHRDSIIDPDLSQYLSDDASSEEEQHNLFEMTEDKLSKSVPENEKATLGGILAAVRKGRSRLGERSLVGLLNPAREGDDASVTSSRAIYVPRTSRKRNLSVASSIHQRLLPKPTKDSLQDNAHARQGQVFSVFGSTTDPVVAKMTRSASMKGSGAPALELNKASLQHVRKLLQQLLKDASISHVSSWETALLPVLLRSTDDVDPDVQRGDDVDIRHYVKLKKIPGGTPEDTSYVSGLVFTKNLALRSMPRSIRRPTILIITFALEYARHEQHFMSLEPVIRQEREYLQSLVGRIAALKPHLLLAQRNISGLALQLLEEANIATAFNVKPAVLEAVSRCTQTRIIPSMDKLSIHPAQTGTCESFEVKTYVFDGRKKTYMYLAGCSPQLGCTIALRGAESSTLAKVKRITEFMVYVVYNLKLETCLMRDEFALIPSLPEEQSEPSRQVFSAYDFPTKPSTGMHAVNNRQYTEEQFGASSGADLSHAEVLPRERLVLPREPSRIDSTDPAEIPDDVPVPKFYEDLVEKHQTKILSASPFVKFMQPYLLMRARELERRVAYLKRLRNQDISAAQTAEEKAKGQRFTLIQPEMVHTSLAEAGSKVREILHAVHDTEYDKALHNYQTQKKQWEAHLSGNQNLFDPYAHQNIVVLFSIVSTSTSVPCSGPDVLAFAFYNEHESDKDFEADCTLGQYVEDLCYRANDACPSNGCEKKMLEHHRQYVCGEAQISVFVHPYPAKMRGMQDIILMWSQCKICGNETPMIPMSMSTWKYSFGKYLELSFWSADLHPRAGICPHDLHRDHLRFFGYKGFALRIHYDAVSLLEIIVPRMRITWKVDNDLRFRNEVFAKIEKRLNRFMVSVKSRLKAINVDAMLPEKAEACKVEVEKLSKTANDEHLSLIKLLQDRYSNSRHWETIPLNGAIRAAQEKVAEWDTAFTDFERDFFPSEKDIRRLATLQLKKIFLDRDVSVTSVTSTEEGIMTPPSETSLEDKSDSPEATPKLERRRKLAQLSPEKTQNVLQSVVEEDSNSTSHELKASLDALVPEEISSATELDVSTHTSAAGVQHLDLAIPSHLPDSDCSPEQAPPKFSHPPSPVKEAERSATFKELSDSQVDVANANEARVKSLLPLGASRAVDSGGYGGKNGKALIPPLLRAQSQSSIVVTSRDKTKSGNGTMSAIHATQGFGSSTMKAGETVANVVSEPNVRLGDRKASERLSLNHLKSSKLAKSQSFIPRSVANRKETRVSNLAKHFEQLSREFEKERLRERKQRAARTRQSRVYPLASSKPIVEVYQNVDDAVEEKETSDEGFLSYEQQSADAIESAETGTVTQGMAETQPSQAPGNGFHIEDTQAEGTETDVHETSQAPSDAEVDEDQSDVDQDFHAIHIPDSPEDLIRLSPEDLDVKELPKHERTSLMKILTNFWAERSSSGWAPLDYPLTPADHVFADCDVIVREDEPSSIIAFALDSNDYKLKLWEIQEHPAVVDEKICAAETYGSTESQADVMHSLLRRTGTHLKYQFQEGPAKMLCKIFFAEQFDAVRRRCGVSDRIVESLSRCMKWDSKGGKTKSLFLKTLDDRFVLKSLSTIETQTFLKFAPNYFQIMSEAFFHELPSVIAKMLGFYQIIIKNPVTGVEYNWFLLVMENLFYDRTPTRIFDLKGSMRNRKIQSTGERNEVLLDENMVEFIYESPLFVREHSKKLLRSSVHNDTLFLARQNVMDYSLMVAIDDNRKELVVGIIDCIRTYTWDKKLESWIKDRGFAGGNKNRPTVTSPREYKKRFREAMGRYVLEAPR